MQNPSVTRAVLSLSMLVACAKQGSESSAPSGKAGAPVSAARNSPQPEGTHQATPPQGQPQLLAGAGSSASNRGRAATITLRGQADEGLRAQATLREVDDAVEIALNVEHASPGTRIVALRDTGSCSRAEPEAASAAIPKGSGHGGYDVNPELGALAIDRSGAGRLSVKVPAANLGRETEGSLLGKALVIYPDRRTPEAPNPGADVLACAQILAE